jgi:type 1 glutamine amidotransferase
MSAKETVKRRRFLQTGAATLTAAAVPGIANAALKPKKPGETKVVCVMGDYHHNPMTAETRIRRIFGSHKDWRIIFVKSSRYFTPELISDADLLITARYGGRDSVGFSDDPLIDTWVQGDMFWTPENVSAIIDNVQKRGMGYLALHCTVACRNDEILGMLDVINQPHEQIQPLWVRDLNQDHPITKGMKPFYINLDEQFGVLIKSQSTVTLFGTTAIDDKRERVGGWCLERDRGRIVGLLPGHLKWAYLMPEYQEILWRSAHWALKRDIPEYPGEKNPV